MKKEISIYNLKSKLFLRIVISLISLVILYVLFTIKLGLNSFITHVYFSIALFIVLAFSAYVPFIFTNNTKEKIIKTLYEIIDFLTIFIVVCTLVQGIMTFGFFRAQVVGKSMNDTLYDGDKLIGRSTNNVTNGDIVVVYYDEEANPCYNNLSSLKTGELIIKRVIAKGGDKIRVSDGYLIINDTDYQRCNEIALSSFNSAGLEYDEATGSYTICDDYFFVMGDNRSNSVDSRYLGPFKKEYIVGKVVYKINSLFDWNKIN